MTAGAFRCPFGVDRAESQKLQQQAVRLCLKVRGHV